MSVDRITDKNITSSSPTSSLFLNSTQGNAPRTAGRFSIFISGRRVLADRCDRTQFLPSSAGKPWGSAPCVFDPHGAEASNPAEMQKERQDNVLSLFLVRLAGVEPARPYGHKHLKLASLPVPAQPQNCDPCLNRKGYYICCGWICQQLFFKRRDFRGLTASRPPRPGPRKGPPCSG